MGPETYHNYWFVGKLLQFISRGWLFLQLGEKQPFITTSWDGTSSIFKRHEKCQDAWCDEVMETTPAPLFFLKGNPNGHQNHGSLFHQCQHVNLLMIAKSPKWCKAWGLHSDDESISSRCQTPKKRNGDFLKQILLKFTAAKLVGCILANHKNDLKEYFPIHIMTSWLMSKILIQHQTESLIEAFASMQANEEDLKACSFKWHL